MRLPDTLKYFRKGLHITQEELAESSGISANTISEIEKGKISPKVKTVEKLANAMGFEMRINFISTKPKEEPFL